MRSEREMMDALKLAEHNLRKYPEMKDWDADAYIHTLRWILGGPKDAGLRMLLKEAPNK